MSRQTSLHFRANAIRAIADSSLRSDMKKATGTFSAARTLAISEIADYESLRKKASAVRKDVLDNIRTYLNAFSSNASKAGATVHHPVDAAEARKTILGILGSHNAKTVVKGRSMVSEEIQLGEYLRKEGVEVVENPLGEGIIQMQRQAPSDIILPPIHDSRQRVGRSFPGKRGVQSSEKSQVRTMGDRKASSGKFLRADAIISEAHFAIAGTGSLVLFNGAENGRMVTTVPPLHIVLLSIEKLLPAQKDLTTFTPLLPRSVTGQTITSHVSVITGTPKDGKMKGGGELHVILVDNGRSEILAGECQDILKCIMCGACINVCPVYRTVGDDSYGWTYPGPMGIILTTLLTGLANSHPLLSASTFCGACDEVCPVKIPLVELIHKLRVRKVSEGFAPVKEKLGMRVFEAAARSPFLFSSGEGLAKIFWPVLSSLGGEDITGRLPEPVKMPFRRRME